MPYFNAGVTQTYCVNSLVEVRESGGLERCIWDSLHLCHTQKNRRGMDFGMHTPHILKSL